jgi:hypothetical protein
MTEKAPPRCEYRDQAGQCPNEATRTVDSRALGRSDASLEVCGEHYVFVKAYWLAQGASTAAAPDPEAEE